MIRYMLAFLLVNTYTRSFGNPVQTSHNGTPLSNNITLLAKRCENPFLINKINSKVDECTVEVSSYNEKYIKCLLFIDINQQLCDALPSSKLAIEKLFDSEMNKTLDVTELCNMHNLWTSTNMTNFHEDIVKVFSNPVACIKICSSNNILDPDSNFFCKYYHWGFETLQKISSVVAQDGARKSSEKHDNSIVTDGTNNLLVSSADTVGLGNIKKSEQNKSSELDIEQERKQNITSKIISNEHKDKIASTVLKSENTENRASIADQHSALLSKQLGQNSLGKEFKSGNNTNKDSVFEDENLDTGNEAGENDDNEMLDGEQDTIDKGSLSEQRIKDKAPEGMHKGVNDDTDTVVDGLQDVNRPNSGQMDKNGQEFEGRHRGEIDDTDTVVDDIRNVNGLNSGQLDKTGKGLEDSPYDTDGYPDDDDHFFPFFLTVVILVVLLYVLYHNKNKVSKVFLGLIVEGRQNGRRRNSRGHAYRRLDTLEQAMSANTAAPPSKIIY